MLLLKVSKVNVVSNILIKHLDINSASEIIIILMSHYERFYAIKFNIDVIKISKLVAM